MISTYSVQFSSIAQSCPTLCDPMNHSTPGLPVHRQPQSLFKLTPIESVLPSSHLILWRPLPLLPSIFPSIRVFSNESALHVKWPKYWNLSFSISPSNEYSGLIFFRMDSFDLLALQGTLTPGGCPGGGERVDRSRVKDSCYLHSPLEWSSMLRPSHLSPRFWTCPPLL